MTFSLLEAYNNLEREVTELREFKAEALKLYFAHRYCLDEDTCTLPEEFISYVETHLGRAEKWT